MKMRWIYLSLLLIISCTEHQNKRYDTQNNYSVPNTHSNSAIVPVKTRASSTVNINMDCVKTEGDYETDSHCIRISNVGDRTKSSEVYFDIIDKNASHKERHKGRIWDWISKKGNLYIYGFQAKDSSKLYEIDWRDDNATYFRIWDSKRQHKYLEEKVIRGPKELLDEAEKAVGKANQDEE